MIEIKVIEVRTAPAIKMVQVVSPAPALNLSNAVVVVGTTADMPTMPELPTGKFYLYFRYE